MIVTMERTQPRSSVRRAAPWLAGAWALAFGALSGLALLGRIADPWAPEAASPLGGLSGTQMSWLVTLAALLVLVAGLLEQLAESLSHSGVPAGCWSGSGSWSRWSSPTYARCRSSAICR